MFSEETKNNLGQFGWHVAFEDEDVAMWYHDKTNKDVTLFENKREEEYHYSFYLINVNATKLDLASRITNLTEMVVFGKKGITTFKDEEHDLLCGIIHNVFDLSTDNKRTLRYTFGGDDFEYETEIDESIIIDYMLSESIDDIMFPTEPFEKWLKDYFEEEAYEQYLDFKKKESEEE